jgi:hypothetical protein
LPSSIRNAFIFFERIFALLQKCGIANGVRFLKHSDGLSAMTFEPIFMKTFTLIRIEPEYFDMEAWQEINFHCDIHVLFIRHSLNAFTWDPHQSFEFHSFNVPHFVRTAAGVTTGVKEVRDIFIPK